MYVFISILRTKKVLVIFFADSYKKYMSRQVKHLIDHNASQYDYYLGYI